MVCCWTSSPSPVEFLLAGEAEGAAGTPLIPVGSKRRDRLDSSLCRT